MLKNDRGITILALVLTVVIIIILTSVSLGTGYSVIKNVRIGRIVSSMDLVKAKVETIYEQYQFSGDSLIGDTVTIQFLSNEEIELIKQNAESDDISNWIWYQWDAEILKSQGLDASLLGEGGCFYVNYEHGEILYNKGTSYNGTNYYSITGLNYVYQEY